MQEKLDLLFLLEDIIIRSTDTSEEIREKIDLANDYLEIALSCGR